MATFPTGDEKMTARPLRSSRDVPSIEESTPNDKTLNQLIENHNFLSKNLSFKSNFDCQVIDVSFTAGEQKVVAHNLGIVPLYRIILRQEGNGVVSDIPSGWTKNSIELINNGAVSVTATIMIVRE